MKSNIINVFIFAAGALIGSAVTWKVVKTKYERIADEEIESFKEYYEKKFESKSKDKIEPIDEESLSTTIEEMDEYLHKVEDCGYSCVENVEKKGGVTIMPKDGPYVISPDEFDDMPDYDSVTLTYYNDGMVTNMWDSPLDSDEVEELIGYESLNHFGDYEDDPDVVYVRNDRLKADYEILRDYRNYRDVVTDDPHQDDE